MKSFIKHESYYKCDCGCEVLLLRQYQDEINGKNIPEPIVEIAICKHSPDLKNWYQQLRLIWNIVLNKEIWSDQIILNKEEITKLGKTLTKISKEIK